MKNWRPGAKLPKDRTKDAFLQHIRDYFHNVNADIDPEVWCVLFSKLLPKGSPVGKLKMW